MKPNYTESFRQQAVEKVLCRVEDETFEQVAKRLGVGYSTLQNWVRKNKRGISLKTKNNGSSGTSWTREQKMNMLIEAGPLTGESLNRYCRKQGLFKHQLEEWKKEWIQSADKPTQRSELRQIKEENKELKRELRRKEKALAETAALLVLKKKVDRLLSDDEDN